MNEILTRHGWNVAEYIMKGKDRVYPLDVKHMAVSFYLHTCDLVRTTGFGTWSSNFSKLLGLVVKCIEKSLQHSSVSQREAFKFGGGNSTHFGQEYEVSKQCFVILVKAVYYYYLALM